MGNLFTALTTSNGNKRLIAIIMMGAGILATVLGFDLPGGLEDILVKALELVGLVMGAWGAIHAQIEKKKGAAGTKAALNSDAVKAFEESK
jgi:hypothetical protein